MTLTPGLFELTGGFMRVPSEGDLKELGQLVDSIGLYEAVLLLATIADRRITGNSHANRLEASGAALRIAAQRL